jgi:hypothetical protein
MNVGQAEISAYIYFVGEIIVEQSSNVQILCRDHNSGFV